MSELCFDVLVVYVFCFKILDLFVLVGVIYVMIFSLLPPCLPLTGVNFFFTVLSVWLLLSFGVLSVSLVSRNFVVDGDLLSVGRWIILFINWSDLLEVGVFWSLSMSD